jgi:AraC family transcriptional activator of tynA and feaB
MLSVKPDPTEKSATFAVDVSTTPIRRKVRQWSDVLHESYFPLDVTVESDFRIGLLKRVDLGRIRFCTLDSDPMVTHRRLSHISPETKDFYVVEMPQETALGLRQRGREIMVQPGDFAIVNSAEMYTFDQRQKNQVQTLRIPCEALRDRLPGVDDWTVKTCSVNQPAVALFLDFLESYRRNGPSLSAALRATAERHLLDLMVLGLTASDARSDETATRIAHRQRALRTIERNFRNPNLEPSDIASTVGLSERYLQKIFSDRSETVTAILRRRRISEAKTLLVNRQERRLSVTQIAYAVGFSDAAYFSRVFRQETGVAPVQYGKGLMLYP